MTGSPAALRRIGWSVLIALCCAVLFGLALKVNAVRSEVRRADARIVALKRETIYLETEYETRANQQQLAAWNAVDFGYSAPGAGQYLENVRQLAQLGQAAGPGAPAPIRVAAAPPQAPPGLVPALVSPLTGVSEDNEPSASTDNAVDHDLAAAKLGERLSTVAASRTDPGQKAEKPSKPAKPAAASPATPEARR